MLTKQPARQGLTFGIAFTQKKKGRKKCGPHWVLQRGNYGLRQMAGRYLVATVVSVESHFHTIGPL